LFDFRRLRLALRAQIDSRQANVDLTEIVSSLRRFWWMPALGLILGLASALTLHLVTQPEYTAKTQLFVATNDSASTSDVFQGSQFSEQRVASYARLLVGEELAGRVISELGLETTPRALARHITAEAVPETVLLEVSVTDASPARAQQIAATVGTEFTQLVADLETPPTGGASPVRVTVVDQPELPTDPSSPRTLRDVAAALLVGLALGVGVALLRARLDRSVRDPDSVAELVDAPLLGVVPRDQSLDRGRANHREIPVGTTESFRQVRTNLQFLNVDQPPGVIMVTSAVPGEGKTTAAIQLGLALAEVGKTVTLIEADLRRPTVIRSLGLVGGAGLTSILTGGADPDDVLQSHATPGLSVIGAGPLPPNPGELLGSAHMRTLIEDLRSRNDYVLIDTPPLLPVADSIGLAAVVDGVLLVVRHAKTRREEVRQATLRLDRVGSRLLGFILTFVPPKSDPTSAYGYDVEPGHAADSLPSHRVSDR
jgi:capsular exopolysaccharide synthesis family protein